MRYLDLGLEDLANAEENFLMRDSPNVTFKYYNPQDIDDSRAKEAGKILNKNKCISLLFLLLNDYKKANKLCRQIENGLLQKSLPSDVKIGEAVMLSLVSYTRGSEKNKAWILKILCALHCIAQYRAISILQPAFKCTGNGKIKGEFDGLERYFVDVNRWLLLRICKDSTSDDASKLMQSMGQPDDWSRLETAFLSQIEAKGSQDALLRVLRDKADPDESIIRINDVDSIALLKKNIPANAVYLKKGKCLIIAQENYEHKKYSKRPGTQKDVEALAKTFRKFGCNEPKIVRDVKDADGFVQAVKSFRDKISPQDKLDYVVICILSHGRMNKSNHEELVGTNGSGILTEQLTDMIIDANQCPQLLDTLKIFLIQACRGDQDNILKDSNLVCQGVEKNSTFESDPRPQSVESDAILCIPKTSYAWYMVGFSTPRHRIAYRDKLNGSPFIQIFCQTMNDFGDGCLSLDKLKNKVTFDLGRQITPQTPEWKISIPSNDDFYFSASKK